MTATTIRIGIPYVDLAAVRQYGVTLDHGNYPDAYNALIAHMNAHGGVDGRKLVPYLVAVNPVGTAAAATACTQLAQDDNVFVAFAPQQPDCYLSQYGIPTINGTFQDVAVSGGTPNFTMQAPPLAYDPIQLAMFAHEGVFKGKTVGIFGGQVTDEREMQVVESDLKSLHVKVAQSAVDSAPTGDQSATYQDANIIAQRFHSAGVNEVVAVGTGSLVWPEALQAEQSTFNPAWVATNESSVEGAIVGSSLSSTYLEEHGHVECGARQLPDVASGRRPAVLSDRAQGIPVRQDHPPDQSHNGIGSVLFCHSGRLRQPGDVHDHRQSCWQGSDPGKLHQGGVCAAQCEPS